MEERLENIIRKVIFKKYPFLTDVNVRDIFKGEKNLSGVKYVCDFTSEKCLSAKEQMEIDTEVKTLFNMLSIENNNPFSIMKPKIFSFFDCGKGPEFHSEQGYQN